MCRLHTKVEIVSRIVKSCIQGVTELACTMQGYYAGSAGSTAVHHILIRRGTQYETYHPLCLLVPGRSAGGWMHEKNGHNRDGNRPDADAADHGEADS
ncbi:hypothetical protein SDC9_207958 [bioreactor metagenome]|uniref:Uncharacterized protein n=1 Tax=bioreactor metagenome TaxID=1076179 RepID=A0A645JKR9_9ZZZZ